MELTYQSDGLQAYKVDICGFDCRVLQFVGYALVQVPLGEGADKDMFDELVYRNNSTCTGPDARTAIAQVERFIREYLESDHTDYVCDRTDEHTHDI